MRKIYKRLAGMLLCSLAIALCCTACGQKENPDSGFSEFFAEEYGAFFEAPSEFTVLNRQKDDVTEAFYDEFADAYAQEDYETIWDAVLENAYSLCWESAADEESVEWSFYQLADISAMEAGRIAEMVYTVGGEYTIVDDAFTEGQAYFGGLQYFDADGDFDAEAQGISTKSDVSDDGKSVAFTAEFHLELVRTEDRMTTASDGYTDCGSFSGEVRRALA